MRECLFCREPAGSKEHIFAQWLIARMGAEKESFVVAHRLPKMIESRKPHGLSSFTTRSVCTKCNNGWMSALEAQFQRHAGNLVEKQWSKIATTSLFAAASEGGMIGKWALKTLICIGPAAINSNVVKPYIAHDLFSGKLPSDFHVRLGYIRDPIVGALITKGIPMRNGGRPVQWQEHRDKEAFKAVLGLNHLAVGIVRVPQARLTYVAWEGSLPVIAYPQHEKLEREHYEFATVETFDKSLEAETWLDFKS